MAAILSFALLAASLVSAQITSGCNPLNTTVACPSDPALGTSHTWSMVNNTGGLDNTDVWNVTNGVIGYGDGTAQFVIAKQGQAPTIRSNFYFFWGGSSITLKAAKGQGIVSSLTYLSDDLDEIDWEWIGGNNTHVQTNYFGKGNTTKYDRAIWVPVDDPQNKFHNYSINWSSAELQWIIDGNVVRSMPYAAADDNGNQFPQTPLDVRMGIWAGGDPTLGNTNYTVEWAGGDVDYSQTPFTMEVQSVTVNDGTTGVSAYNYPSFCNGAQCSAQQNQTIGSWKNIKTVAGNSTALTSINQPPPESIVQKFNDLSTPAKIGIACAVGGTIFLLAILFTICCVRKRKEGRREREAADADWDRANSEMLAYREQMKNGAFAAHPDSLPQGLGSGPAQASYPQAAYMHQPVYSDHSHASSTADLGYGHEKHEYYGMKDFGPPSPNPQYAPRRDYGY